MKKACCGNATVIGFQSEQCMQNTVVCGDYRVHTARQCHCMSPQTCLAVPWEQFTASSASLDKNKNQAGLRTRLCLQLNTSIDACVQHPVNLTHLVRLTSCCCLDVSDLP